MSAGLGDAHQDDYNYYAGGAPSYQPTDVYNNNGYNNAFNYPGQGQQYNLAQAAATQNLQAVQNFDQEVRQWRASNSTYVLDPHKKQVWKYTPSSGAVDGPKGIEPSIIANIDENKRMYFAAMTGSENIDTKKYIDDLVKDPPTFEHQAANSSHPGFPIKINSVYYPGGVQQTYGPAVVDEQEQQQQQQQYYAQTNAPYGYGANEEEYY